jgi:hypothetical protein
VTLTARWPINFQCIATLASYLLEFFCQLRWDFFIRTQVGDFFDFLSEHRKTFGRSGHGLSVQFLLNTLA